MLRRPTAPMHSTMGGLHEKIRSCHNTLRNRHSTPAACSGSLDQVGECLAFHNDRRSLNVEHFLSTFDYVVDSIVVRLEERRTHTQVLLSIIKLCYVCSLFCGELFRPIADRIVVHVILVCSHVDARVATKAKECLTTFTETVSYDLRLIVQAADNLSSDEDLIQYCTTFVGQIPIILETWDTQEYKDIDLFPLIANCLVNDHPHIRKVGYAPLAMLYEYQRTQHDESSLVHAYLEQFSKQTVDEIFREVPSSSLAQAIRPLVRRPSHYFPAMKKQMQSPVLSRRLQFSSVSPSPSYQDLRHRRQNLYDDDVPRSAFKKRPSHTSHRRSPYVATAYRRSHGRTTSLVQRILAWVWFWIVVLLAAFGFMSLLWFIWTTYA
ncbi:hypothetical protein H310_14771 [Aphanomyces invadans]|uniref:CLASP N-terminal domain-containing protein n=1 Tax=Aphanomyces invadans TaxID=157072 RepID=A0A024T8V6_9STRA|nr:hypothetical protein H310_14771 [Aphanomyces invadans]ETV90448.1 hypothetical protein H310_14771 [Aphanomyces invadans]|eukprot:XP_008880922.1 hypothetical protein H310_14771 [Aphanomyces invadans]